MSVYGEEFDELRGDPRTLMYAFKTSPLPSGRSLWAFTARRNLAVIRQHTRTASGLKEVAIGFDAEQLRELRNLIPTLLKEMEVGRTSDEDVEVARNNQNERINSMNEGPVKTALKNISSNLDNARGKP